MHLHDSLTAFSCDCKLLQAHAGHFGSYLLGKEDRPTVLAIVKTLANELTVTKLSYFLHMHN
jgi:hypothetical protein